ncbi:MAG: hypothetical protein AAF569_06145 [Pseudomonadota bacterium]
MPKAWKPNGRDFWLGSRQPDPKGYTSNTVFDSFPWPQEPSLSQVKKVAMSLFEKKKPCMALIRKGRVAAIPTDQCHLAASDDDTLVITPHVQNAAYMHVVCRKPIWLYDKAADIKDIYQSAKDVSEYVILVCRPEEEKLVRKYAEEWAGIKPGVATAACA